MKIGTVLILLFTTSCLNKQSQCNLLETIFYQKSESYIEVFSIKELIELDDSTQKRLCKDNYAWSEIEVKGLNIPAEILISGRCEHFGTRGCFISRSNTEIRLENGKIYLNDSIVSLPYVKMKFQSHFYSLGSLEVTEWQNRIVTLDCKKQSNIDFIESVIYEIVKGYADGYESKMKRKSTNLNCKELENDINTRIDKRKDMEVVLQYSLATQHPFLISLELN